MNVVLCRRSEWIVMLVARTVNMINMLLAAYEQAIGGYHPAEKWLKDRKGRALTQDDLRHYQRIILALDKTRNVMEGMSHADESA